MSSRFVALAVRGESFLLETDHGGQRWSVLVDGGQDGASRNRLHPLVQAISKVSPNLKQIDVAVCTHNDADHAGGFPNFLDEWLKTRRAISEVWLPWRWSAALPTVLTDPDGLIARLADGAVQAATQIEQRLAEARPATGDGTDVGQSAGELEGVVRELGRRALAESPAVEASPLAAAAEPGRIEWLQERLEGIGPALGLPSGGMDIVRHLLEETDSASRPLTERAFVYFGLWPLWQSPISLRAHTLLRSTIETAEKIRSIAETALRNNILIRWFDFDAFENGRPASGGWSGFFTPVNAVEMAKPRPELEPLRLLFSLRLTEQNVESLVFQRVETGAEPGVVFLGDSRLAFGVDRPVKDFSKPMVVPRRNAIVTAAHHGSRVNDNAYKVLDHWLGPALASLCYFIRNGGMWKQTLEKFLTKSQRRCAQCQQCFKDGRQQNVIVEARQGEWSWPPDAKACGRPRENSISIRC